MVNTAPFPRSRLAAVTRPAVLFHNGGDDMQAAPGTRAAGFGGDVGAENARQQVGWDTRAIV